MSNHITKKKLLSMMSVLLLNKWKRAQKEKLLFKIVDYGAKNKEKKLN
jgi:hypothetical protein